MAATNKGLNLLPSETYHISETRCGTDLSRFSRFYVPPPGQILCITSKPGRARAARHASVFELDLLLTKSPPDFVHRRFNFN